MEQTFLRALKGGADSRQYRVKKKSLAEGAGKPPVIKVDLSG